MRRRWNIPGLRFYGGIASFVGAFALLYLPLDFSLVPSLIMAVFIGICIFLGLPKDTAELEAESFEKFIRRAGEDIRVLGTAGKAIKASPQRQTIMDVTGMATSIVKMTQERKKVDPELDHFLAYYLSRFLQLVNNYAKLENDRYVDQATKNMMVHIGSLIQEVRDMFSAQYNKILRHELGDLASVTLELESMIELQRSEFGISDLDDEFAKLNHDRKGEGAV